MSDTVPTSADMTSAFYICELDSDGQVLPWKLDRYATREECGEAMDGLVGSGGPLFIGYWDGEIWDV